MVQFIAGEKGKGKTKILLEQTNKAAAEAKGNIVFIDKDMSHIYEVKNSVRLVNISNYGITDEDEFYGFLAGIVSADHDLEEIFVDRFLKVSFTGQASAAEGLIKKLDSLSNKFDVKITLSISCAVSDIPEEFQSAVAVAL